MEVFVVVVFFPLRSSYCGDGGGGKGGGREERGGNKQNQKMLSAPLSRPAEKISVLLSASVERFGVSCIWDFIYVVDLVL